MLEPKSHPVAQAGLQLTIAPPPLVSTASNSSICTLNVEKEHKTYILYI